eukprot:12902944-Prorocentrum_lima.AAC.1
MASEREQQARANAHNREEARVRAMGLQEAQAQLQRNLQRNATYEESVFAKEKQQASEWRRVQRDHEETRM